MYTYLLFLMYIYIRIYHLYRISHRLHIDTVVKTAVCVHMCTNKHLTSRNTNVLNNCMYIHIYMHKYLIYCTYIQVSELPCAPTRAQTKAALKQPKQKKRLGQQYFDGLHDDSIIPVRHIHTNIPKK